MAITVEKLLSRATSTGANAVGRGSNSPKRTFQATGFTTSGAGSATIKIQGSLNETEWVDIGTITLTLATTVSTDGFATDAPWKHIRANLTAITGTGAEVTVWMGS